MKVVLFCGGLGMRLRDHSQNAPKPLAMIGNRPLLWHLMTYYAHFGHKDFILCLGYRGDAIKEYFLNYDETVSNDFLLRQGGRDIELQNSDIDDWTIRFVDTGLHSNIGMRLKAVQSYLEGEEMFLANYADGLCDLDLHSYIEDFELGGKLASFISVPPHSSFHMVETESDGTVSKLRAMADADIRVNGGFFVFRNKIFDYINEGEELVIEPFSRLAADRQLVAHRHDGFWECMDTFKDKQLLEDLAEHNDMPWQVWKHPKRSGPA